MIEVTRDYVIKQQEWLEKTDQKNEVWAFLVDAQEAIKLRYAAKAKPMTNQLQVNHELKLLGMLESYAQKRFDALEESTALVNHRFVALAKKFMEKDVFKKMIDASHKPMSQGKKMLEE